MLGNELLAAAVNAGQTLIGLVWHPYATYRRILEKGRIAELVYIALLLAIYFAVASLVKTAAFRPFLLTKQFVLLTAAVGANYAVAVGLLWYTGLLVGGRGRLDRFALAWAYTLIPTLCWFLATSLLYVVIPPPRTTAPQGILFSVLYLVFSSTLLFWKVTLAYLTLRFGLKLDLKKISIVFAVVVPALVVYSAGMYKAGIFRIPFL